MLIIPTPTRRTFNSFADHYIRWVLVLRDLIGSEFTYLLPLPLSPKINTLIISAIDVPLICLNPINLTVVGFVLAILMNRFRCLIFVIRGLLTQLFLNETLLNVELFFSYNKIVRYVCINKHLICIH